MGRGNALVLAGGSSERLRRALFGVRFAHGRRSAPIWPCTGKGRVFELLLPLLEHEGIS